LFKISIDGKPDMLKVSVTNKDFATYKASGFGIRDVLIKKEKFREERNRRGKKFTVEIAASSEDNFKYYLSQHFIRKEWADFYKISDIEGILKSLKSVDIDSVKSPIYELSMISHEEELIKKNKEINYYKSVISRLMEKLKGSN